MAKARYLFKKTRDREGTFPTKMGSIKDRSDLDLTEAEDIKKRWQEYTEIEENNRMGKTRGFFKKIRDTKETFHAKMGSIKDRNDMDLKEAEDIKKRQQEYTEELYKKDLHNQDNHDGVITHLEPDILECEVKWALESITTNKASGGNGIPVELFKS